MKNILITGATGNVGMAVIKSIQKLNSDFNLIVGVRDANEDNSTFENQNIKVVLFDVTDSLTFATAFKNIDVLFLLRPPQISEVQKYFEPLIESAIQTKIKHIVFLSVQGVEKSSIIPHHKIEKLIVESKIYYTFLRPAYFMQNFTSTLHKDLVVNKRIYLPAGKAKFTLIDVNDIGNVAAIVLTNSANHLNKIYELTNNEKLTFTEIAEKLSFGLKTKISYISPNIFSFYLQKRKEETPSILILVMIMLHYFPRFQAEPKITNCVKQITTREPKTFYQFIQDNVNVLKN
jgi:uncharacterized protein YbjT (DUF2867 family)